MPKSPEGYDPVPANIKHEDLHGKTYDQLKRLLYDAIQELKDLAENENPDEVNWEPINKRYNAILSTLAGVEQGFDEELVKTLARVHPDALLTYREKTGLTTDEELANLLIDSGQEFFVAAVMHRFKFKDPRVILSKLLNGENPGNTVLRFFQHIRNELHLSEEDIKFFADEAIKKGLIYSVISEIDAFPELDQDELADIAIKEIESGNNFGIANPAGFTWGKLTRISRGRRDILLQKGKEEMEGIRSST